MNLGLDKWDLCFVIYMFLSNNPSSGDINLSNLPCLLIKTCYVYSLEMSHQDTLDEHL